MCFQCALPAGGAVGREPVHCFRDALCCHADPCLDEPERERLGVVPQAVLPGGEDQAVRESGQRSLVRLERGTQRIGGVGIPDIKVGVQLFRLGTLDPERIGPQLRGEPVDRIDRVVHREIFEQCAAGMQPMDLRIFDKRGGNKVSTGTVPGKEDLLRVDPEFRSVFGGVSDDAVSLLDRCRKRLFGRKTV